MGIHRAQLAKMIDHTLLRPEATREEVVRVCEEGKRFGFASVCINPAWSLWPIGCSGELA